MKPFRAQVRRFSTSDPDEFAERITSAVPNNASVRPLGTRFHSDAVMVVLPRIGLCSISIDNTHLRHFDEFEQIGVNIPLAEPLRFRIGAEIRVCSTGMAFVRRPGDGFDLIAPHQSSFLVAHLSRPLRTCIEDKLGYAPMLSDSVSLETPAGASFFRYLCFILRELQRGAGFPYSALATREMENSLGTLFYAAAENGHQDNCPRSTPTRPGYLVRAEEYIRANLTEPLSVLDIAAAVGVSPRTLSQSFRKHRGVSTKGFVKQRRLEAAQQALLAAPPGAATVTEIALRFGFSHMGRFSVDYHRAFGEIPSETLRR